MSKYLVVEFPSQTAAYQGEKALRELHGEGSITVYGAAVLTKGDDGNVKLQDERDEGFIGTALGTLSGSLIGILGGPAGVAAGMLTGGMIGWLSDMENLGVGSDFADEVSAHMKKGSTAVIAEIEEYWATPVNSSMHALGGKIYRKQRFDFVDEQRAKEIKAWHKELKEYKDELKEADAEHKAAIEKNIEETKAKIAAAGEKISKRLTKMAEDTSAKLAKLEGQKEKASADRKAKIDAKITEINKDTDRRKDLLHQASSLTKEALK